MLIVLLALLTVALAAQTRKLFTSHHDAGLFTPMESLHALSEAEFTTLTHPLFPHYSVRIKKSRFCDQTVE
jgi:hypothetical protein